MLKLLIILWHKQNYCYKYSMRKRKIMDLVHPNFLVSAAVAEFEGPVIYSVVRLAKFNMELARVEATFSGISPGGWSINEFGHLTRCAESTGKVYNQPGYLSEKMS